MKRIAATICVAWLLVVACATNSPTAASTRAAVESGTSVPMDDELPALDTLQLSFETVEVELVGDQSQCFAYPGDGLSVAAPGFAPESDVRIFLAPTGIESLEDAVELASDRVDSDGTVTTEVIVAEVDAPDGSLVMVVGEGDEGSSIMALSEPIFYSSTEMDC